MKKINLDSKLAGLTQAEAFHVRNIMLCTARMIEAITTMATRDEAEISVSIALAVIFGNHAKMMHPKMAETTISFAVDAVLALRKRR